MYFYYLKYQILTLILTGIYTSGQTQQLLPESDEFNNTCSRLNWIDLDTIEGWNATQLEMVDVNQTDLGKLDMMPYTTAWFADRRSNLIYKKVSGNFVFTTSVQVTNRTESGLPSSNYSLGGPMVRVPRAFTDPINRGANGENYIFLSCGYAAGGSGPHFEVKSTTNSNSNLQIINIDTAHAAIRLARINNAIIALYQLPGGTWTIRRRYYRSDFPDTLQVGLVAYTDWNKVNTYTPYFHNTHTLTDTMTIDPSTNQGLAFNPDVLAKFDFARFEEFEIPIGFENANFALTTEVSDIELLSILGYSTVETGNPGWKIWQGNTSDWSDASNWSDNVTPSNMDSIMIPNCNCTEVISPIIKDGESYTISALIIENKGRLNIEQGGMITINMINNYSKFNNFGTIDNEGLLQVNNIVNKEVINTGQINCIGNGTSHFVE